MENLFYFLVYLRLIQKKTLGQSNNLNAVICVKKSQVYKIIIYCVDDQTYNSLKTTCIHFG